MSAQTSGGRRFAKSALILQGTRDNASRTTDAPTTQLPVVTIRVPKDRPVQIDNVANLVTLHAISQAQVTVRGNDSADLLTAHQLHVNAHDHAAIQLRQNDSPLADTKQLQQGQTQPIVIVELSGESTLAIPKDAPLGKTIAFVLQIGNSRSDIYSPGGSLTLICKKPSTARLDGHFDVLQTERDGDNSKIAFADSMTADVATEVSYQATLLEIARLTGLDGGLGIGAG